MECSGEQWRSVEDSRGLWKAVEVSGGQWRSVKGSGGQWRAVEGRALHCKFGRVFPSPCENIKLNKRSNTRY